MKKLHLLFLFLFVYTLCTTQNAYAQAEVSFDNIIYFTDADGNVFESVNSKTTLTPSGSIVKKATFQLPEDHDLVPPKGKNYIAIRIKTVDIFGEEHYLYDWNVSIGKSGEFKVVLHLNGSGAHTPNN